jgi:iron complex outermembrane receptor protein
MTMLNQDARLGAPSIRRSVKVAVLAGASALALSTAAYAADSGDANSGTTLDEVTVTARKVSENVQTTPVSVSAVSLQQIKDLNIVRLDNIQKLAPNLTVVTNGPSSVAPMLYLRGIGSPSVALYSEPPVALYVDGVYTPRPTSVAFDIPDMAGIEVLRGPQGTLFGRNTTGGAILIRTEAPRHEFGGSASLSYGSNNDVLGSLVVHTGEVGPFGLRAKLVLQDHEREGWVTFPGFSKSEWGGSLHTQSVALTIAADLNEKTSVEFSTNYNKLRSAVGFQTLAANANAVLYFQNSPGFGGPPFIMGTTPQDLAYRDPRQLNNSANIKTDGDRFTLTYDGGPTFQFKSISGYSHISENLTGQLGGSYVLGRVNRLGVTTIEPVITHLTPSEPGKQTQFSQEFNASGQMGHLSYAAGLYFFHEAVGETVRTIQMNTPTSGAFVATLTDRSVTYSESTKSVAAYGQVNYKPEMFDDKLELSAGLRISEDRKTLTSETFATSSATGLTTVTGTVLATGLPGASTVPGTIGASHSRATWSNTGWSLSASYQVTPDIFAFVRTSSAIRAGGFNAISTNSPSYAPEKAVSTEFGIKSEWFDRRARLNVTGFHTDYQDLQITQFIGPPKNTTFITNAGKATFDGFEVEGIAKLPARVTVDFNYGYVFPKYKEYLIGASPLPALCVATPKDPSCFQNVASVARFPFLSKQSIHVGAQWVSPETGVGVFTVRVDYSYKSSFLFGSLDLLSPNNTKVHSGIDRNLSARVILSDIPFNGGANHLKIQVFGDNLTDNRYIVEAVDFSTTMNGIFNRPRNYGVIFSAEF